MKIKIDDDSYITLRDNSDNTVSFSIKAAKDANGYILMSVDMDSDTMDELISKLVVMKAKVDSRS